MKLIQGRKNIPGFRGEILTFLLTLTKLEKSEIEPWPALQSLLQQRLQDHFAATFKLQAAVLWIWEGIFHGIWRQAWKHALLIYFHSK